MDKKSVNVELFRHLVATVAYRAAKAINCAPDDFANFKASPTTRTPLEILSHMGDLFDWSLTIVRGASDWKEAGPLSWSGESVRFFAAVKTFDDYLASGETIHVPLERLIQGPMADALTHVGQIAMLKRMHHAPMKSENYFKAEVEVGRVGLDQSEKRTEFD